MPHRILDKLQKVRKMGKDSWICSCPAHQDKSPSMTVRKTATGKILIHCFGGCTPQEILDAIGLKFEDLYPEPLFHYSRPESRKFHPMDVLRALSSESKLVAHYAIDLKNGKPISEYEHERLIVAIGRITEGIEYAK